MGQLSTCCVDYSNILDDDSLLNTFYLYRPFLLGEDQDEDARLMGGSGNGSAKTGGTNLHMFVKGGESLYLDQRSTCVFPLSVQKAHPFWTCWHIRPPFHSSLITLTNIMTSPQRIKRDCVTGVDPITIRQSLSTELVMAAL